MTIAFEKEVVAGYAVQSWSWREWMSAHLRQEKRPEINDPQPSLGANNDSTVGISSSSTQPENPTFSPPTAPDEIGRLGKYRIQKELGRGGMGAVYLAFDDRLQRKVALKVMLPKAAANPTAKDRFLREARAAAQISSDYVVSIYEADEIDGVPFIALQYLQGYPLDQYMKKKGTPSLAQTVRLARETALGLAAAHKLGLVHRDIKPGNIWLEAPSGRVKILDFGLAKPVVGREQHELTASGAVVGTPAYMAPEQGMGRNLDSRADLFSLGVMLYRLVTNQLPFDGPTLMAILTAIATQEPKPVLTLNPLVSEPLADLIHRLLAKNPDERPATAVAVAKELESIGTVARKPAAEVSPDAPTIAVAQLYTPMVVSQLPENPFENLDDGDTTTEEQAPLPNKTKAKTRRLPRIALGIGALFALVAVVGFIIVKITNKDGSVTEIKVPDGSKIEVSKDGKPLLTVDSAAKPTNPVSPRDVTAPPVTNDRAAVDGSSLPAGKSGLQFQNGDQVVAKDVPMRPTTVVTIEAWVTFTAPADDQGDPFLYTPNGRLACGRSRVSFYSFHGFASNSDLVTKGKRVHVAGVNDGKKRYLYINGKRVGESEDAGEVTPENERLAAAEKFSTIRLGTESFCGIIDSLHVSSKARYDKEFSPPAEFKKDQDTFALYLFDEGEGETLKDSSGNGYHAKITGAQWVKGAPNRVNVAEPDRKAAEYVLSQGGTVQINESEKDIMEVKELPKELFQLTSVNLLDKKQVDDASLAVFQDCKKLKRIVLRNIPISDRGLRYLKECTNLTNISLNGTLVGDSGFELFREFKNLSVLELGYTKVSDIGLSQLQACKKLTRLDLDGTAVTDDGLRQIGTLAELRVLKLDSTRVTDKGLDHLKSCIKLTGLHLQGTAVSDQWLENLKLYKDLSVLSLYGTGVTDRGVEHLKTCVALAHLWLGGTKVSDAGLAHLKNCKDLTRLYLHNSKVTDAGLIHLMECKKLTELELIKTNVTKKGLAEFQMAVPGCRIEYDGGVLGPSAVSK